ncbi:MAG: preprotein translocase subunit SecY [Candidatus Uhrbacteria bacterium]|nr:preprotein translocase subunit SecY [Candidatus Uhrbacteria bacterium]
MEMLKRIFKVKELRNSLLFILFTLTIFRVAAHITVPGIDASGISSMLGSNQFLGLLNVFSGGTLENFSIVALGVAPYITSSIIFQLLGMIFPQFEELQKEEQGRQKINKWTRYATAPLAFVQGFGLIKLFGQQAGAIGGFDVSGFTMITALISMAAGTIFLMWLGELITERNVGNGISILILAGIVSGFPSFIQRTLATYTSADLFNIVLFVILSIVTVVTVVVVNEGQRNIPVQYARGVQGVTSTKVTSHLPIRVNMGGMIPIIFAISVVVFPPLVAQFFVNARTEFIRSVAEFVLQAFGNSAFYAILYFTLVFVFTFFYAGVIFKPENVAENLQKQGGFIPGIRPGAQTAKYLNWVKNRILLTGAAFLGAIAVLPLIVQEVTGSPNLIVGGAAILIIVSVVIDIVKQVESQVTMRRYDM